MDLFRVRAAVRARVLLSALAVASAAASAKADPLSAILDHRATTAGASQSEGCGLEAEAPPSTIEVDGQPRRLIVVLPEAYDAEVPHALVVAFHGRTSPAEKVRRYYGLERQATRPTVFVYPSGLTDAGRQTWSGDADPAEALRDYRLFDAVIRRLDELYCIDRGRVFAVGHSLGAWFTNSLGCARGDVLRAIGTVAGGISGSTCRGQTSAILLHHPLDRLVPYERAREVLDVLIDRPEEIRRTEVVSHSGFDCMRFMMPKRLILFCPHGETRTSAGRIYPHQWPDRAGEAIMRFFEALP